MDAASQQRLRHNLTVADEDALVALANRGLYRRAVKDLEQNAELAIEETDQALLVRGPGWCVTMPPEGPAAARDDSGATGVTRFVLAATIYLRTHWLTASANVSDSVSEQPTRFASDASEVHASEKPASEQATASKTTAAATSSAASPSPAPSAPADSPFAASVQLIVQSSIDELTKWSGKGAFLQATARLKSIADCKVQTAPTLTIDFVNEGVRVLLMTDRPERTLRKLLDQFKTTAAKSELTFWVVLAVLVLKRQAGEDLSNVNVLESDITQAIREDRLRVAARCQRLLASATISGVAHPSTRIVERFETCAVAAEAARFPRLARLLNSIASDIQLQIARSAAADPQRLIDRILVAHALSQSASHPNPTRERGTLHPNPTRERGTLHPNPTRERGILHPSPTRERGIPSALPPTPAPASVSIPASIPAPRPELYGRSRSQYVPGGSLELHGLGAYAWRADSGFEGVTALFWDQANQRFMTAAQARGEGQDRNFSLAHAYTTSLGWSNSQSLKQHCRQRLRLDDTKLNWDGRLSSSESCSVTSLAPTCVTEINFGERLADDWSKVAERARQTQPLGLRITSTSDLLVILKPARWGNRWFDELEQQFVWDLSDAVGRVLQVRVPWNELEESSIEFLETIKPERENLWGLVGRVNVQRSQVSIYPLSLLSAGSIRGDTVFCPHFDQERLESRNQKLLERLRAKHGRNRSVDARIADPEEEAAWSVDLQAVPVAVRSLLVQVERILHGALETGAVQLNQLAVEQLAEAQQLANSLGIKALSQSLDQLLQLQQPAAHLPDISRAASPSELAAAILDSAYATRLATQAAANIVVDCSAIKTF